VLLYSSSMHPLLQLPVVHITHHSAPCQPRITSLLHACCNAAIASPTAQTTLPPSPQGGPSWWDPELRDWVDRIFKKSGLGDNCTFLPKSLHPKYVGVEQQRDHLSAEQEARETVLPAVEGLLQKTGGWLVLLMVLHC
jgi:hypothetical protein